MGCQVIQYDYQPSSVPPGLVEQADLIFSDPPYNIGVKYEDDETGDKLDWWEYCDWMTYAVQMLSNFSRPGATLWWVCPEEHADEIGQILTNHFGPRLYRIVWHETFSQYNRHDLTQDYRFIFCHYKDSARCEPLHVTRNLDDIRVPSARMEAGDKRAAGPRIPGRVWQLRRLQGTAKARVGWHPAQMPPEVLDRILRGWSNPGDLVLDAFAGSGSLGLKAQELGRQFVGIDKSPTYCTKMRERLGIE